MPLISKLEVIFCGFLAENKFVNALILFIRAKLSIVLLVLLISRPVAAAENMPVVPNFIQDADKDQGVIMGRVINKDKTPLANGTILLYKKEWGPPPSWEEYLRIPTAKGPIDNSGKFIINAYEGTYYVVALKWAFESKETGPPKHGDPVYILQDEKGNFKEVAIKSGSVVNVGIISQTGNFDKNKEKFGKAATGVEGIVLDSDGKPVEGAIVMASVENKLLFASYKTGKDGKFILRTNDGGIYNLTVTNRYGGGRPEEGEQYFVSEEHTEGTAVMLKKGERLKGVKLKIKKITMTDFKNRDQPVN